MRTTRFWLPVFFAVALVGCGGSGKGKVSDGGGGDGASKSDGSVTDGTGGAAGAVAGDAAGSGAGGVAGAGTGGSGGSAAVGCGVRLTSCGGSCVATHADPKNCGACGKACQPNEVCLGNTCAPASSCPDPTRACAGTCVDPSSSNDHCGGCGNKCPAGQGCQSGGCKPGVPVGPAPAKCANGGPPIIFPDVPGGGCAGRQASATFKLALCSCGDIGVPIPLSSELITDGYDSGMGPYRPGGLGAAVGANGGVSMTSKFTVFGELRSAGTAGVTVGAETTIHESLHVAGGLQLNDKLTVKGDASINGSINGASEGTIAGALLTPSCAAAPARLQRKSCANGSVTVPPPCACQPGELVPIAARIAHYADPTHNDNAAINLKTDVFARPGAPARLDLPCGHYYLDQIHSSGATTIAVHGHTALFVGGSIQVDSALTFTLDATATLDVYVGGTMQASALLTVGSPAYPARSRFYVGGVSRPAGAACKLDGECSSLACEGGSCASGGTGRPFSVNLSSDSRLAGLFYAPNGGFVTSSNLDMYGALFVGYYQSSSKTAIHYDRATIRAGWEECPAPAPPTSGAPADAGSAPPPDGDTPPPCVPRDEDGDGYYACDCWKPTMSCAPTNSSPTCAADCCDRPGDPGCPAGLASLTAAAAINPGRVDINCDGTDNNCAIEGAGGVTSYVCSGGTQMCLIP